MKRLLTVLLLLTAAAFAQGVRIGDGTPVSSTLNLSGVGNILTPSSTAAIAICTYPANAVPCTNKATTYTTQALSVACATSVQVTLPGTSSCVANADSLGNWGAWVADGTYDYTITVSGHSYGPYTVSSALPGWSSAAVLKNPTADQAITGFLFTVPNLITKVTPIYDVRAYASVQAAIDAANTAGGGVVRLAANTTYTGTISLKSNVILEGTNWTSVLTIANTTNANVLNIAASAVNVGIRNLKIDGNASGQGAGNWLGIGIGALSNVFIDNTEIYNTKGDGIRNTQALTCTGIRITNNYIHDIGTTAIEFLSAKDVVVANNYITAWGVVTAARSAIGMQPGNDTYGARNIVIANNAVINTVGTQFGVESSSGAYGLVVDGCTISGNLFDGGGTTSGGVSGFYFDCSMTGNSHVKGGGSHRSGYELVGTNLSISGNIIQNGSIALAAGNGGASGQITVSGNTITNAVGATSGIEIGSSVGAMTDLVISNNNVTHTANGANAIYIGVYSGAGQLNRVSVIGNKVLGPGASGQGIRLGAAAGSTDIDIKNNTVSGFANGYFDSANANTTEVTIAGNDFRGNGTPINHSATGTFRIWENVTTAAQSSLDLMNGLANISSVGKGTFVGVAAGGAITGATTIDASGLSTLTTLKVGASGSTLSDSRELVQNAHSCGTTTTCANTANGSNRIIFGTVALTSATPSTAVVTGITAFTSTSSYVCVLTNMTNAANNILKVVNTSTTSFTITGPNTITDTIAYQCIGN